MLEQIEEQVVAKMQTSIKFKRKGGFDSDDEDLDDLINA